MHSERANQSLPEGEKILPMPFWTVAYPCGCKASGCSLDPLPDHCPEHKNVSRYAEDIHALKVRLMVAADCLEQSPELAYGIVKALREDPLMVMVRYAPGNCWHESEEASHRNNPSHRIGVHDYESLVECLKSNWEQAFPDMPFRDPQDAIQMLAATVMQDKHKHAISR